ncbi:MAG: tetratricopeptide repeat protein [Spirochaetaceae bacterium]|jgi:tetratricopeptide (TPR) repeat protein|nr:tetratricopeptide repeat protein [Spirochaetaceae bacterium]
MKTIKTIKTMKAARAPRAFLAALALAASLSACATNKEPVPPDLSPMELIQRGQEASDINRYAKAIRFYQAVIERYPSYIDEICASEYEIAFIHYKQKKYDRAAEEFHALLARYDTPDGELLPPQFNKLSRIVLAKIETKRKKPVAPPPAGGI